MSTADQPWWRQIPTLPTPGDLHAHWLEHHQPVDAEMIAAADPDDLAAWHHGEHSQRHPGKRQNPHSGHLGHTHPAYVPDDKAKGVAA